MIYIYYIVDILYCRYIYISTTLVWKCRNPIFAIRTEEHWSHTVGDSSPWSTYKSESSDPTLRIDQSKPANRAFYSPQSFSRIRALFLRALPLSLIIRVRGVWGYINIGRWSLADVRSFASIFETFLDRLRLFYYDITCW